MPSAASRACKQSCGDLGFRSLHPRLYAFARSAGFNYDDPFVANFRSIFSLRWFLFVVGLIDVKVVLDFYVLPCRLAILQWRLEL